MPKISELTGVTADAAADVTVVVQLGTTKKRTQFIGGNNYFVGVGTGNSGINTVNSPGNVAIGFNCARLLVDGDTTAHNVAIGYGAMEKHPDAHFNVAIGYLALGEGTGASENVGIGYKALQNVQSEDNVAIGFAPGVVLATGRNNIIIGYYAGCITESGGSGTNLTSGNGSIMIGQYAQPFSATGNAQINIGNTFFSNGNAGANPPAIPETGNASVYVRDPTARWHLPAGQAAAGKAPLKLTAGTNLTTPEAGAIEFDGTNLYFTTSGGTRKTITAV